MYDPKTGKLTRDGAIGQIRAGGSVLINGRLYGSIDKLPGEAEFAKGDKDAENVARERLIEQQHDIKRQLDSLGEPVAVGADEGEKPAGKQNFGPRKVS